MEVLEENEIFNNLSLNQLVNAEVFTILGNQVELFNGKRLTNNTFNMTLKYSGKTYFVEGIYSIKQSHGGVNNQDFISKAAKVNKIKVNKLGENINREELSEITKITQDLLNNEQINNYITIED